MAYEIPQQLAYKEKIIFGLTFEQVGWLFLFMPFMILIFFKTPLNLYVRITIVTILGLEMVGFMFLRLRQHLFMWIGWWRLRNLKTEKQRLHFSGVTSVENDTILRRDGKRVSVLKVEPINFSIKPKDTQEAVTGMFQKFLNSIDFPVQIAMYTESLDLKGHFTDLEHKTKDNEQFTALYTDYKEHLNSITQEKNIMNRSFYVIIPEKRDLAIQTELCQKKLEAIGLRVSRLPKEHLTRLVEHFFGKDMQKTPIINAPSHLAVGTMLQRVLYAHGYPRSVEAGFLDRIVSLLGTFDVSLHIEPYDIETMMVYLNKELQKQRADLYAAQTKGIINPSLEIQYSDTRTVLENLQKGKEKLFNVSLYINCRASTNEALDKITRRIESELNSLLIIPKHASFRMLHGVQSCAPLAWNRLNVTRNVTTEALSAFFPFTSSFLSADLSGIWFGLNKNNIPLIKDVFKLSNPNGLCLASSGAGKSYLSKLMIARHLLNGTKVMVIDPQGEYNGIIKRFNGQRIDLSRTSKTIINPLDLMGHEYPEKRLALMDLMPIMLGELTEPQKAFIDRAITSAYERKGIFMHDEGTWNNEPPIIGDVYASLESLERRATMLEKPTVRSLMNRLALYTTGVFAFLNTHTKIDFDKRFVSFDIGNLPKQVKPTMMFLVLDYVYMKMKSDLERKLLVIDEAWSLLGRAEEATYIFEIVKTCRKFNLALYLINQEVEGMLGTEAGKSVLANSSYTILLRQKPAVIKNIKETFSLSDTEKTFLLTAAVGEGILLMDDEHSELRIIASPEEHGYITTKPDELNEINAPKLERQKPQILKKVEIKVDASHPLYIHKELSLDDVKYLVSKGYTEIKQYNLHGKRESYLIKVRQNESESHAFLTYLIADYLKSFTDNVQLYQTSKPDIVFSIKGVIYAIEIETGKVYQKDKAKLNAKIATLKTEYGKNWFFVITNRNLYPIYSKLGETCTKKSFVRTILRMIKGADTNAKKNTAK